MKAPVLLALVVGIHAAAICGFSLLTGCATPPKIGGTRPPAPGPSAAPSPAGSSVSTPSRTVGGTVTVPQPPRSGDSASPVVVKRDAAVIPSIEPAPAPSGTLQDLPGTQARVPGAGLGAPRPTLGSPRPPRPAAPAPAAPSGPREGTPYKIQKGDMLSKIAVTYGISWRELAEYNGITNPAGIREGQEIIIPPNAKKRPTPKPAASAGGGSSAISGIVNAGGSGTYKVQAGDSLSRIASRNGTTVAELKKLNNLTSDMIRVGQELKISGTASVAGSTGGGTRTPTRSTDVDDIIRSLDAGTNSGAGASALTPIPTNPAPVRIETPTPAVPPEPPAQDGVLGRKPYVYTVVPGDTVRSIASSFIVSEKAIRQLNGLAPDQEVNAGDKINIPNLEP